MQSEPACLEFKRQDSGNGHRPRSFTTTATTIRSQGSFPRPQGLVSKLFHVLVLAKEPKIILLLVQGDRVQVGGAQFDVLPLLSVPKNC